MCLPFSSRPRQGSTLDDCHTCEQNYSPDSSRTGPSLQNLRSREAGSWIPCLDSGTGPDPLSFHVQLPFFCSLTYNRLIPPGLRIPVANRLSQGRPCWNIRFSRQAVASPPRLSALLRSYLHPLGVESPRQISVSGDYLSHNHSRQSFSFSYFAPGSDSSRSASNYTYLVSFCTRVTCGRGGALSPSSRSVEVLTSGIPWTSASFDILQPLDIKRFWVYRSRR